MTEPQRNWLIAALALLALVFFDLVFAVLISALHLPFEVLHIAYEWLELGIEHMVEHLFHTSRHNSQIITFYILVSLAGTALYRLYLALPQLVRRLRERTVTARANWTSAWQEYWLSLGWRDKFGLYSAAAGLLYLSLLTYSIY